MRRNSIVTGLRIMLHIKAPKSRKFYFQKYSTTLTVRVRMWMVETMVAKFLCSNKFSQYFSLKNTTYDIIKWVPQWSYWSDNFVGLKIFLEVKRVSIWAVIIKYFWKLHIYLLMRYKKEFHFISKGNTECHNRSSYSNCTRIATDAFLQNKIFLR